MPVNPMIYGHLVLIEFRLVESPGIEPNQKSSYFQWFWSYTLLW